MIVTEKSTPSRTNEPKNSVSKINLPDTAISGPIKAAAIPPTRTAEAALGISSGFTLSIAAKRNCRTHALVNPKRRKFIQSMVNEAD